MRTAYETRVAEATLIERNICRGSDKIVGKMKWVGIVKHLWPHKTAAMLASIADKDVRTGERWLEGDHEPPGIIVAAIVAEMFKREGDSP